MDPIVAETVSCQNQINSSLVDDNVGVLYDPADPLGLVLALRKSLNLDLSFITSVRLTVE